MVRVVSTYFGRVFHRCFRGKNDTFTEVLGVTSAPGWRLERGEKKGESPIVDVPVWTPRVTRPIWPDGCRSCHRSDRSGTGGRTTHHSSDRHTDVSFAPRGGKRCVLCQRLPSTTTPVKRTILTKRAQIVHVISPVAVLRFGRAATEWRDTD